MNTHAPVTREQLAELVNRLSLSHADTTRNDWVKVGQAIHDGGCAYQTQAPVSFNSGVTNY
jgi:hypothetical protein